MVVDLVAICWPLSEHLFEVYTALIKYMCSQHSPAFMAVWHSLQSARVKEETAAEEVIGCFFSQILITWWVTVVVFVTSDATPDMV